MGSQRVGCDWVTELNWTELKRRQTLILRRDGESLGTRHSWGKHGQDTAVPSSSGAQWRKVGNVCRAQKRLPYWKAFVPRAWLPAGPHAGIRTGGPLERAYIPSSNSGMFHYWRHLGCCGCGTGQRRAGVSARRMLLLVCSPAWLLPSVPRPHSIN